jgi:hypothetical protein
MTQGSSQENDGASLRRVDVELFIKHPTMTGVEITTALNLESPFTHNAGDKRKTPKGTPLQGRYPDTRWRHSIQYQIEDQWFADKITDFVQMLMPHKTFLHQLRATGGRAELIVQFFGDGYLGDSVPLDTLAKMAELKLDFGIECFSVPQS